MQIREGTHGGDWQTQRMQKRDEATHLACIESCTRLFGSIPAILWAQLLLSAPENGDRIGKKNFLGLLSCSPPSSDGLARAKERACCGKWAESSGE